MLLIPEGDVRWLINEANTEHGRVKQTPHAVRRRTFKCTAHPSAC